MAANIRETDALNLETVEAIAILRRLQQCMHMGISHLIIESDCLFVVKYGVKIIVLILATYYLISRSGWKNS